MSFLDEIEQIKEMSEREFIVGSDLRSAVLFSQEMNSQNFIETQLSQIQLVDSKVNACKFIGTHFLECHFASSTFSNCLFRNTTFTALNASNLQFINCTFENCQFEFTMSLSALTSTMFENCVLDRINFASVKFEEDYDWLVNCIVANLIIPEGKYNPNHNYLIEGQNVFPLFLFIGCRRRSVGHP